jgi:hypothetical protein
MGQDELEELTHLWDGTEDWVLHAFYHSEVDLKIVFEGEHPSIQEIMAVRKLLEEYREIPVQKIKAQIGASKVLSLGKRSTFESQPLLQHAQEIGLTVVQLGASHTGYLPFNRTDKTALIIEDDELSERVAKKMLEAGVPVTEHTEID